MKKILNYIILAAFASACLSCSSLDQTAKSTYDDITVFSNYTLSRYAVNAIYVCYSATYSYRTDYLDGGYGVNTDVDVCNELDTEKSDGARYKQSPTNSRYNSPGEDQIFAGNYKGIERANVCIQNLEKYGDIDNRPEMGALYGEALTIRAILYADLLNIYGEVPARFEPVSQETIYLPKSDKDVIYKQLLGDLQTAAKYMTWDNSLITVPGKACALGMYARLALQASGYSCRPDEGKVNTGAMGRVRKSTDPELQMEVLYPKALEALEDIINNAGLSLFDKFEDLWRWYCGLNTEYGKEVIYGLPFADTRGAHLVRNALPNSKYNYGVTGGNNGPIPTFYFRFDKRDTRRKTTCVPHQFDSNGQPYWKNNSAATWYNGKFRLDWYEETHHRKSKDNDDGAKFTYLRYADILLMASEIANELGDLEKAKSYMRPILVRAYQSEALADEYLALRTDKDEFFEAIKDQRAFEFCGELLRRQDLIRWGILKKALDETKVEMQNMRDRTGKWASYSEVIYWRVSENGIDADLYGFDPGETENKILTDPEGGWQRVDYFKPTMFNQRRIDEFYLADPEMNMYRPIPASIITANMGVLQNDYGYTF